MEKYIYFMEKYSRKLQILDQLTPPELALFKYFITINPDINKYKDTLGDASQLHTIIRAKLTKYFKRNHINALAVGELSDTGRYHIHLIASFPPELEAQHGYANNKLYKYIRRTYGICKIEILNDIDNVTRYMYKDYKQHPFKDYYIK